MRLLERLLRGLVAALDDPRELPPPPESQSDAHGRMCNVNLFQGGTCDCDGPDSCPTQEEPQP